MARQPRRPSRSSDSPSCRRSAGRTSSRGFPNASIGYGRGTRLSLSRRRQPLVLIGRSEYFLILANQYVTIFYVADRQRKMFILEYKLKGKPKQYQAIDEAIRTVQFVRNKCLRYWSDGNKVEQKDIYKYVTQLRKEFDFVKALNSTACQQACERTWTAILKFYTNCKKRTARSEVSSELGRSKHKTPGKKADATEPSSHGAIASYLSGIRV